MFTGGILRSYVVPVIMSFSIAFGIGADRLIMHATGRTIVTKTAAQYTYEPDLGPTDQQIQDCQAQLAQFQEYLFRDADAFGDRLDQLSLDNLSRDNSMFIEASVQLGERRPGVYKNFCDTAKNASTAAALHKF